MKVTKEAPKQPGCRCKADRVSGDPVSEAKPKQRGASEGGRLSPSVALRLPQVHPLPSRLRLQPRRLASSGWRSSRRRVSRLSTSPLLEWSEHHGPDSVCVCVWRVGVVASYACMTMVRPAIARMSRRRLRRPVAACIFLRSVDFGFQF